MKIWTKRSDKRNAPEVVEVTERQARRTRIAGVAGLALAGLVALTPAGGVVAQQFEGGSPARGHAQVVAQSVIELDGPVSWDVTRYEVEGRESGETLAGPGFLIGADGLVLITDVATGGIQRLAEGEATAVRGEAEYERQAIGGDAALFEIGLVEPSDRSEESLFTGNAIEEIDGLRDVDLLRDSLKPGEKATIDAEEVPALILVTDGELNVRVDGLDEIAVLEAGDAEQFQGEVEIVASKEGRATFVAAVIGPEIETGSAEATPESDGGGSGNGGSQSGSQPAPDVTVVPDSDGDGLNDNLEAQIGTDPQVQDTDQDGLLDGDEYYDYGSDPLSMDGDGDMLPDYNEVMQHGTDPMNPDTDDDSLSDHDELNYNTQPLNPDSDGDGLLDGMELLSYGSDPLDTDTDDDGLGDGDEIGVYGSHPNMIDTDSDMLPDFNEVMQHGTDPAVADTDADGINDHDELGYGTSLLDADSDDDGALDGAEIFGGTNPLDPNSKP